MIVDVELMMSSLTFRGPLESFTVLVGIKPPPSGAFRTHCNVMQETRMCALVSRL